MAGFRCTRRWTPRLAASTGKLRLATPALTSMPSSKKWRHCARPGSRFISFSTTLSAHKTQLLQDFLQRHPCVFHFTPTYSSWLNRGESWFAKIERDVIARGIFTPVTDLARKLRRYTNAYSANARPIRWKYSDPSRRLSTNEFTAIVLDVLCLLGKTDKVMRTCRTWNCGCQGYRPDPGAPIVMNHWERLL